MNQLKSALCPTGKLRASINLGNALLAGTDDAGNAVGVSVDLARELAQQLGVDIELQVFRRSRTTPGSISPPTG